MTADTYTCPICAEPINEGDMCLRDIDMGDCHARCLDGFGRPITVCGHPGFWVGDNGQYVRFVRPDSDVILNSHPLDVRPA